MISKKQRTLAAGLSKSMRDHTSWFKSVSIKPIGKRVEFVVYVYRMPRVTEFVVPASWDGVPVRVEVSN